MAGNHRSGRPTKLTPEVQRRFCDAIRASGCTIQAAAALAGVGQSTIFSWLEKGEAQKTGLYREFLEAVHDAMAASEALLAGRIAAASTDDWKAAAWILERRFPDNYGNRVALIRRYGSMSDEELDAYIASEIARLEGQVEDDPGTRALPDGDASDGPEAGNRGT